MYLHLLDPTRDRALVNKSASVLAETEEIPDSWWDPVPHQGLVFNGSKWVRDTSIPAPGSGSRAPVVASTSGSSSNGIGRNGL